MHTDPDFPFPEGFANGLFESIENLRKALHPGLKRFWDKTQAVLSLIWSPMATVSSKRYLEKLDVGLSWRDCIRPESTARIGALIKRLIIPTIILCVGAIFKAAVSAVRRESF